MLAITWQQIPEIKLRNGRFVSAVRHIHDQIHQVLKSSIFCSNLQRENFHVICSTTKASLVMQSDLQRGTMHIHYVSQIELQPQWMLPKPRVHPWPTQPQKRNGIYRCCNERPEPVCSAKKDSYRHRQVISRETIGFEKMPFKETLQVPRLMCNLWSQGKKKAHGKCTS